MSPHHILVVDDTATNRQILSVFLRRLGHSVDLAEDGAKAVQMFAGNSYDLIIMDVMMPVMDGYEATRRIKAASGDRWVPILFLSALDKDENLVAGLEAGGDDYLPKPVNFVVLEAKLRSLSRALSLRRELEDTQRFTQAVTDNLLDAVITIDEHGQVESVNPAACRIFGYPGDELVGRNVSMLMPEPQRSEHDGYIARYVAGGAPHIIGTPGREVTGVRKDGSTFPLSLSVSEFSDRGRRMFVGALRDISDQKAAEQKLRENTQALQVYHDEREAENALAEEILDQFMRQAGLFDDTLHYWMSPATNFSGDIVAAARAEDGRFYAMLADATGHGLAAAISVLPAMILFHDTAKIGLPLARVLSKINGQMRASLPVGRFVACNAICHDSRSGRCEIWMGGMPPMLLLDQDGRIVRTIVSAHLPLGIEDFDWRSAVPEVIELPADGYQLAMFSDGLTEARNAAGEEFGFGRLEAALRGVPPARRIDAVKDAMLAHMGDVAPHDDITLMFIDLPAPRAQ